MRGVVKQGTTSAHAENTPMEQIIFYYPRNYLRARGEYTWINSTRVKNLELPPRTRRILFSAASSFFVLGTTSAHAENTRGRTKTCRGDWNYLRARGEYQFHQTRMGRFGELPPRTRRILGTALAEAISAGTTSAHAENTPMFAQPGETPGNYLRARGEYSLSS